MVALLKSCLTLSIANSLSVEFYSDRQPFDAHDRTFFLGYKIVI